MRRLLAAGLLGCLTIAGPLAIEPALAAENDACVGSMAGTALDCELERLTGKPANAVRPSSPTNGSGIQYVAYPRVTRGPDGQECVATGYYQQGTPLPADASSGIAPSPDRVPGQEEFNILYQAYPPCPAPEPAAGAVDTPGAFAARFWERIPMPKPDPRIAPGWAIVGKLAYLETNGVTQKTYQSDSPFGPLQIVATGRYYIDWGDGESSGPHSREGRPWPDGQISHDYQWAGTYDVIVTQRWTATWSLAGQSGILRELRTTGRIDDFPAREIQAVIRS